MINIKIKVYSLNSFPLNIQMDLFSDDPLIVTTPIVRKKSQKKRYNNRKEQLYANPDEYFVSDLLREGHIKCPRLERFLSAKIQSLRQSKKIS